MSEYPDLTTFKALSFDVFGTLIDCEAGFRRAVSFLTSQLPSSHPLSSDDVAAIQRFSSISGEIQQKQPTLPYNEVVVEAITKLAKELNVEITDSVAEPIGNSPGTWGPFPDTVAGLQKLKKHYKLIILSNVDNANIRNTLRNQLAPVEFDAVYTAQDIGSYKPDHRNFEYLFGHARKELDIDNDKGDLLHVARCLNADHIPAKELGLRSVWISRGGDKKEGYGTGGDYEKIKSEGKLAFEWRFDTIGAFADEVERQFAAKGSKS